ncbi:MAG: prepilin-type N-terminal cleavage/methylation domain-containing protein [Planctomycetaceae bacterium]|nr:prepilin-type N-terminal cleavage/methylation domain-containing protein [Planctomycetaceae bacterium]
MTYSIQPRRHAFTLTELLVVIAVLAVLVTLLIPSVSNLAATATNIMCMNNLKTIGQAVWVESDGKKQVPPASWVSVLRPHVDDNASVFRCPASSDYYATASAGKSGGAGTSPSAVDISQFIQAWTLNGYNNETRCGLNAGMYSFNDDTPWSIHMSETQRNGMTASNFGNRIIGTYQGSAGPYPNDLVMWYSPDYQKLINTVYDGGDGSGIHYWAVEIYSWGGDMINGSIHYRFTKPFIRVEPYGNGVKVWTSPLAPRYPGDPDILRGSGYYGSNSTDFSIVGKTTAVTASNKGPLNLMPDRQFAISQWAQACFNPQPGVAKGDLNVVPGSLLCCTTAGYEDFLILPPGASETGGPAPGSTEPEEDLRTNYGMNEEAQTLKNPDQIFAIDYVAPSVKINPALDDWDTQATYDSNNDHVLDFARHRGKVNVLFVDGRVRSMDPDEINPKEAFIRQLYWQPQ